MPRAVSVALVNLPACARALGADGLARLQRAGVSAVDLRLPIAIRGRDWDALVDLAVAAWACGLRVYVHSWEGRWDGTRSTADALEGHRDAVHVVERILALERAGRERGVAADLARVKRYRGNWERDVWRGLDGFANPQADEYLEAFLDTIEWRDSRNWPPAHPEWKGAEGHELAVDYLGFADPDRHYRNADADHDGQKDDDIPGWLKPRIGRVALMVYQTRARAAFAVLKAGLEEWPTNDVAVFLPCGRIDSKAGQIGNLGEIQRLLELLAAHDELGPDRVLELVIYVGNDAEGQLLVGHAGFPSIEVAAPLLAAAA